MLRRCAHPARHGLWAHRNAVTSPTGQDLITPLSDGVSVVICCCVSCDAQNFVTCAGPSVSPSAAPLGSPSPSSATAPWTGMTACPRHFRYQTIAVCELSVGCDAHFCPFTQLFNAHEAVATLFGTMELMAPFFLLRCCNTCLTVVAVGGLIWCRRNTAACIYDGAPHSPQSMMCG